MRPTSEQSKTCSHRARMRTNEPLEFCFDLPLHSLLVGAWPDHAANRMIDPSFAYLAGHGTFRKLLFPSLRLGYLIELAHCLPDSLSPMRKQHVVMRSDYQQPPFRSKQEVIINAPLEAVWSFSMDLTKIPEFHPRVVKVDLLSGKTFREPGASYQCHLRGGKHTCIEKDIEIIPLQKIVTVLPEDTFGISKILSDYRVETTFQTLGHRSTKVEISHYYSTTTLKAKLLNLMAKGKIARDTQATLNAAKAKIEAACRAG